MNLREFCYGVDRGGIAVAESMAQVLRENGYWANEYVSNSQEEADKLTEEQTVRWFLGQFISIVEGESWFAVNSWINCIDKFVPEHATLDRVNREILDPELFQIK